LGSGDGTSSELPGSTSIPEVDESTEDGADQKGPSKPHKGTSFAKHVDALTRKSAVYQGRKAWTNACLLVGPIFFPILMFALQAATNALFLGRDDFQCGCKCVSCCKDVFQGNGTIVRECGPVNFGTCEDQDGDCDEFDEDVCGIQYSKPVQAIWCPIRRPSTWPPVMDMPRTRYFPPPYGPFQAMPLFYTSDSDPVAITDDQLSLRTPGQAQDVGRRLLKSRPDLMPDLAPDVGAAPEPRSVEDLGGGRSLLVDNFFVASNDSQIASNSSGDAVTEVENRTGTQQEGYLYREDWQWEVETGINGTAEDTPQLVANSMMNLPRSDLSPTNSFQVLNILQNLVVQDNTTGDVTINGHLLALLGFKFASAHMEPYQYYVDTTFINEGKNSETDVVLVTMPNKTCEMRNMSYDIYQTQSPDIVEQNGEPYVYWVTRIYDLPTFLITFYSYDIDGLEEFLEEQDFDPQEEIKGTPFERIRVGCVDAPTKRFDSQEALDDTLFCGWYQGKPVGKAECFKKYNESLYGPTESYAAAFQFGPEISISNFTAVVQHNCSLRLKSRSPTDGFCRYTSLLNLAVQGWDKVFIGPPRAPNISTIFQNNNTASLEAFEEFLESENAQQFEDNEDFRRTREFFRNNNITAFANNETAQGYARDFLTNETVRDAFINDPTLRNASRPFLKLQGDELRFLFRRSNELLGVMSFPKLETSLTIDFSSLIGPLFYTWVVQLALPSMLQQLVYEKEFRLRVIMKMHGLPDSAYWLVSYVWNFLVYAAGIILFVIIGSAVGLKYFIKNSYGVQAIFYILYGQVQMAFTFFLSSLFSNSRTAVVAGYVYVLASGLLGFLLFQPLMDQAYWWLWLIELIPAFALYRGLYEFGAYAFVGAYSNTIGLTFEKLNDEKNGMVTVWIIMAVEWAVFMVLAWYTEQVIPTGNGTPRHPLFIIDWMWRKDRSSTWAPEQKAHDDHSSSNLSGSASSGGAPDSVTVMMQRDFNTQYEDVKAEVARVEALQRQPPDRMPVITSIHLRKLFPSLGGTAPKLAVKDMTIAISQGECVGLLGPNGAGKTTSINMLTGLMEPSGGDAVIAGYSIRKDMPKIHRVMGVCPQHDLTWDVLTGREHLLFYGRLKGLKGKALHDAVDEGLHSVALHGLVGNKLACEYSGGMRRRLSVGMAFMGQPRVVYLDEPSTGLDPMSRKQLWSVVKAHKASCAIILTTHSMQEAELLCDRIGIFVEGQLVCLDTPSEITSRFAGFLVLTVTVPLEQEPQARRLAEGLTPAAHLSYALGGTLKYELPKDQVTLSDVFKAVHAAKDAGLRLDDWAVTSATLEEVFIKLARVADDSHLV